MKLLLALLLVVAIYIGSVPLLLVLSAFIILRALLHLWIHHATSSLQVMRSMDQRLFFGERTAVRIELHSQSALPVPWILLREHVPLSLATSGVVSHALMLPARGTAAFTYELTGKQRGYHAVGPIQISAGEVLGLSRRELEVPARSSILVYPRLLSAHELELPTLVLFGDLRSRRHLIGDPARMHGVREYLPGDPLHDIHWRATASSGALQVKHYQPSTAAQTMIFLDLQRAAYPRPLKHAAVEYAISVAATLASRLIEQRQAVGLATTGLLYLPSGADHATHSPEPDWSSKPEVRAHGDRLWHSMAEPMAPARGRGQLLQVLETLACLEVNPELCTMASLLTRYALSLPWGATIVIITAQLPDELFVALHRLREAGLSALVLCVRSDPDRAALEARARSLGARLHFQPYDQSREAVPS
ncbi:MAG TPA: DUF58 domain-containing protein [Chloroflexota bacterium]|nr:DUF58 domain-containing protein [Chloroflexota bacterium]